MPFRRLRYFVAVAEQESFGRAARHLNIAQSALSRHVATLEESVGARLLERSPHGARLTAVGRVLFEDARRLLGQLDATHENARLAAAGSTGQLTIGLIHLAVMSPFVTNAIAAFISACPRVDLRMISVSSIEQIGALRSRKIDAGFMIERSTDVAEIDHLPVVSDAFVLGMRADHPLASRASLGVDDLHDEPFVTMSLNRYWLAQSKLLAACRARGFQPRSVIEVDDASLQMALIARSVGIGFVNLSAGNALPRDTVLRPVEDLNVGLSIELAWMRDNDSPPLAAFAGHVRAAATSAATAPSSG